MIHRGSSYKSISELGCHLQQLQAILRSNLATGTLLMIRFGSANETTSEAIRLLPATSLQRRELHLRSTRPTYTKHLAWSSASDSLPSGNNEQNALLCSPALQ